MLSVGNITTSQLTIYFKRKQLRRATTPTIMKSFLLLSSLACTSAFFFQAPSRTQLKQEILDLASETKRGVTATSEQNKRMYELFEKLEKLNPTSKPLKSSLVNGDWSLQYTTSSSISGKGGFPRVGPIVQTIDANNLKAENSEVVSYFGIK